MRAWASSWLVAGISTIHHFPSWKYLNRYVLYSEFKGKPMYYYMYKDTSGYWRWNLKAANHEIIASGEAYHNRSDCLSAINLVKASNAAPVYEAK